MNNGLFSIQASAALSLSGAVVGQGTVGVATDRTGANVLRVVNTSATLAVLVAQNAGATISPIDGTDAAAVVVPPLGTVNLAARNYDNRFSAVILNGTGGNTAIVVVQLGNLASV